VNLAIPDQTVGLAMKPAHAGNSKIEIPILAALCSLQEVFLIIKTDGLQAIFLDQCRTRISKKIPHDELEPDNALESASVQAGRESAPEFVDRYPRGIHKTNVAR
jgi:hypothetical protein